VCPKEDAAIVLYGMWSIWMQRKKRRHGESGLPIHKAAEWIPDTATDLWHIMHIRVQRNNKSSRRDGVRQDQDGSDAMLMGRSISMLK
jgi:hypothetical protein